MAIEMIFERKLMSILATLSLLCGAPVPAAETAAIEASDKTAPIQPAALADAGVFFDDFTYFDAAALAKGGWIVRNKIGHPGIEGAQWGPRSVTVLEDPDQSDNRVLRLSARTDGTPQGTVQAQLCHARKFFEGTYAARVRFTDTPVEGPKGDVIIQSFYLISPLRYDFDPEYSELDWEYLPNGGWGSPKTRLYVTSWQTVQIKPWNAFNQQHQEFRELGGWHILLTQIAAGKSRYFLDGVQIDEHGGRNYPVVPMSINFNLWYAPDGLLPGATAQRIYHEDIDWVFHARNRVLSPAEVGAAIKSFRKGGTARIDSVPAADPPLFSPCDL